MPVPTLSALAAADRAVTALTAAAADAFERVAAEHAAPTMPPLTITEELANAAMLARTRLIQRRNDAVLGVHARRLGRS